MNKQQIIFFPELNMGWVMDSETSMFHVEDPSDATRYGVMPDAFDRATPHNYQLGRLLMDILEEMP